MSKDKKIDQKIQKGKRYNARKATAERYIPLYEFLMYDPKYRTMKPQAKILYSFLRKKSRDNAEKTEKYEEGEEGFTRSFRDENGEIYVVADNSELSVILQCNINRVKDYRDELKAYGLLEEVPRFREASRLYVLIPDEDQLEEVWDFINEMNELREEMRKKNREKAERYKAKNESEKRREKTKESSNDANSSHNPQNAGYNNSQNAGYYNPQNAGQIYSKGFKYNLNSFKDTLNLSIQESNLPISIQRTLLQGIDRLMEYQINISDIEIHFQAVKDTYPEAEYNFVLNALLQKMKAKPRIFADVINDWLQRNRETLNKVSEEARQTRKPVRVEVTPDWMDEDKPSKQPQVSEEEIQAKKKEIERLLRDLKGTNAS